MTTPEYPISDIDSQLPILTAEGDDMNSLEALRSEVIAIRNELYEAEDAIVEADEYDSSLVRLDGLRISEARKIDLVRLVQVGNPAEQSYLAERGKNPKASIPPAAELGSLAMERIIFADMGFIIQRAVRHKNSGIPIREFVQEASEAYKIAVLKFDFAKGKKVLTYAGYWIDQRLQRYIENESRTIRIPVWLGERLAKARKAIGLLAQILGREPTQAELATHLDMTRENLAELFDYGKVTKSLNEPAANNDDDEFGDFLPDPDGESPEDMVLGEIEAVSASADYDIDEMLSVLTPNERTVLILRLGLDGNSIRSLKEVGEVIGVTKQRTKQIETKALQKLRRTVSPRN